MTQPAKDKEQEPESASEAGAEVVPPPAAEAHTDAANAVEETLKKKDEEIAALRDQLLRAMAEMENVRRRAQRDQEDATKYAVTGFARDLVNVVENLQRALDSVSPDARAQNEFVKNLTSGVEMTLRELLSVFEKQGIKRIEPLGQKFDHNLHQAMAQVETSEKEPGTIVQVLQAGYVIHDRLLRPAMVTVAKPKSPDTPPQTRVDTHA